MAQGKITREENRRRLDTVRELLNQRRTKAEIKRELRRRYSVGARTAERYLSRVRGEILADTGRPRSEHHAEAYAFYLKIARDEEVSTRDRLRAQARIDKLMGLEDHSGPVAAADAHYDAKAQRSAIVDALDRLIDDIDREEARPTVI
ncbi:MAG: hypothetical protein R3C10_25655 [Pirellulales bacterium]